MHNFAMKTLVKQGRCMITNFITYDILSENAKIIICVIIESNFNFPIFCAQNFFSLCVSRFTIRLD